MTAAAEGGKASAAVEAVLAEALGLSDGDVRILCGKASPRKVVEIVGLSEDEIDHRLAEPRLTSGAGRPAATLRAE